ncbi:MAG: BRCT domain-containing protein [Rhodospirillaceae bacterium]|nr:BRCT domain-containing protein [Rhodospirillaceae bacterium]
MIRPAKFADIVSLVGLLKEAHARGRFALTGQIDERMARATLKHFISRHGGKGEESTHCMVAETAGSICGLHIGVKMPIAYVGVQWEATDLMFVVSPRASRFVARALLKSFFAWAETDSRIVRILPAVTDIVADWRPLASTYEKLGFRQTGVIVERMINRKKGAAVAA